MNHRFASEAPALKAAPCSRREVGRLSLLYVVMAILEVALVLLSATNYVRAAGPPNDAPAAYRDGVVLVAFRNGVSQEQQRAILAAIGATEIKRIGVDVHVLNVGPGRVMGAIRSLKARNEIRYAEPDLIQHLDGGTLANDTFYGNQWAFQNIGQTANGLVGTPGADERTAQAWGFTTGTNTVVVAVLDSGVQYSHPDLLSNMWSNPGGIG